MRWMCGASLKESSVEILPSLLGIHCVTDVVRCSRLRWFGYLEHKSEND